MSGLSSVVSSGFDSVQSKEMFLGQVITLTSFLNTLSIEKTPKADFGEIANNKTNNSCQCESKSQDGELSQEKKVLKRKEEEEERNQRIKVMKFPMFFF